MTPSNKFSPKKRKKKLTEQRLHAMGRKKNSSSDKVSLATLPGINSRELSSCHYLFSLSFPQALKEIAIATLYNFKEMYKLNFNTIGFKKFFCESTIDIDSALSLAKNIIGIQCDSNCPYCCYVRVEAFVPELFIIKNYIDKKLTKPSSDNIYSRISDLAKTGKTHDEKYWTSNNIACPFLENNNCIIYDVRPLLCKQNNSTNKNQCKYSFQNNNDDSVPSWLPHRQFYYTVISAATLAMRNARLPYHSVELVSGMDILIKNPDAEKKWFDGQDEFAIAVTPDNASEQLASMTASLVANMVNSYTPHLK